MDSPPEKKEDEYNPYTSKMSHNNDYLEKELQDQNFGKNKFISNF